MFENIDTKHYDSYVKLQKKLRQHTGERVEFTRIPHYNVPRENIKSIFHFLLLCFQYEDIEDKNDDHIIGISADYINRLNRFELIILVQELYRFKELMENYSHERDSAIDKIEARIENCNIIAYNCVYALCNSVGIQKIYDEKRTNDTYFNDVLYIFYEYNVGYNDSNDDYFISNRYQEVSEGKLLINGMTLYHIIDDRMNSEPKLNSLYSILEKLEKTKLCNALLTDDFGFVTEHCNMRDICE